MRRAVEPPAVDQEIWVGGIGVRSVHVVDSGTVQQVSGSGGGGMDGGDGGGRGAGGGTSGGMSRGGSGGEMFQSLDIALKEDAITQIRMFEWCLCGTSGQSCRATKFSARCSERRANVWREKICR